ncbi:S41 family peptidase [Olivibacter sp. SA151]|uniref:S41 family peptidase n=1 Tax=Olivibacter jilunii TaxID=985016 RepID=UPI003F16B604
MKTLYLFRVRLIYGIRSLFIYIFLTSALFFTNLGAKGQNKFIDSRSSQDTLTIYVGEYAVSPNFILTFKVINGELAVTPPGQKPIPIVPISNHTFADKNDKNVQMMFVLDGNGSVEKVILNQHGEKLEARRVHTKDLFNPDKLYSVEQLKTDLKFMKDALIQNHPRPFEFVSKETFEDCYDSLLASINQPMNEIAFRYLLLPLVAKIHCGHTKLDPSIQFQQSKPNNFPPFVLYYEGHRAFIRYSANKDLPVGVEVKSINGVPISQRIQNLLTRVSGDGIHLNVQYYLINQPMSWFIRETPYWYNIERYDLSLLDSTGKQRNLSLTAIDEATFRENIPPPTPRRHQLNIVDGKETAILSYPTLDFPDTSIRNRFLAETFENLKTKGIKQLVIDLRGNGGGSPHNAAFFLKYLIPHEFSYSDMVPLPELDSLKTPIRPAKNHFEGNIYLLIDGGCYSSTGHLLSLLRYHKIGIFVGETTSASYSCNTNGISYLLPNTKLALFCPKYIYETAVNGFERADGISPDYEIKQSFKDVLSANDQMMEYAISIVENDIQ